MERRTFLQGFAALPAISGLALVSTDPVFAAIEKHKAANAASEAAVDLCGKVVGRDPPHLEAAWKATSEAEEEARYDMHEAVPTTIAGLVAYVAYWSEYVGPYLEDRMGRFRCLFSPCSGVARRW